MHKAAITAEEISVTYGAGHTAVRALDKVNLRFRAGENGSGDGAVGEREDDAAFCARVLAHA